jgi:AcrR family transcriptional regulator
MNAGSGRPVDGEDGPEEEARLLDGVLDLVGECGIAHTSMHALLDRTGMDSRTFHRYFGSIEEALRRSLEREAEILFRRVRTAATESDDWAAGLRAGLTVGFDFVDASPGVTRVLLIEKLAADNQIFEIHQRLSDRLCQLLDTARAQLPPDRQPPPLTARFALGAIEYVATAHHLEGVAKKEHLDSVVYFVLLLFFGRDAAERERNRAG